MLDLIYLQGKYLQSKNLLPPFGFSQVRVTKIIDLLDGEPIVTDIQKGNKYRIRPFIMKGSGKLKPNLLAENVGYVFGLTDKKAESKQEAYRNLLMKIISDKICVDYFQSILDFLDNSELVKQTIIDNKFKNDDVVEFEVDGYQPYEEIIDWWQQHINEDDNEKGQCLVTGKILPLIKVGGKIKGVPNTLQNTGTILTANQDSCSAYGLKKANATPVSVEADHIITSTINYLLSNENYRVKTKDDVTLLLIDNDNLNQSHITQLMDVNIRVGDEEKYKADCEQFTQMWKEFKERTDKASFDNAQLTFVTFFGNSGRIAINDYYHLNANQIQANFRRWFDTQKNAISEYTTSKRSDGYVSYYNLTKGLFPHGLAEKHGLRPFYARDLFNTMVLGKPISDRIKSAVITRTKQEATNNVNNYEYHRSILLGMIKEYNNIGDTEYEKLSFYQGQLWGCFTLAEAQDFSNIYNGNASNLKSKAMESFSNSAFVFADEAIEKFKYAKVKTYWAVQYDKQVVKIADFVEENKLKLKRRRTVDEAVCFSLGYRTVVASRFNKKQDDTSQNVNSDM